MEGWVKLGFWLYAKIVYLRGKSPIQRPDRELNPRPLDRKFKVKKHVMLRLQKTFQRPRKPQKNLILDLEMLYLNGPSRSQLSTSVP